MKRKIIVPTLAIMTFYAQAFELTSDNFELSGVCHEGGINITDMNLPDGTEIQTQDGKIAYWGDSAGYSTLVNIPAGTGIFIKGTPGTIFDTGSSRVKIETALKRDGHNLVASCQNKSVNDIDMSELTEIQDHKGLTLYSSADADWADKSDLEELHDGEGYWAKGDIGMTFSSKDALTLPDGFTHQVINNKGDTPESTYQNYTIKLFSKALETADSRQPHTSILVRIDGHDVPLLRIQESYNSKKIVVAVYTESGEIIAISDDVIVDSSGHGNIVELSLGDGGSTDGGSTDGGSTDGGTGTDGGTNCDAVTDIYPDLITAKDNSLSDVSQTFNGFQIKVTTSATVDAPSTSTTAIYGQINGESTNALLKLNSGYPSGTTFVVKVYKDGKLVGISSENTSSGGSAINFGLITTETCSE